MKTYLISCLEKYNESQDLFKFADTLPNWFHYTTGTWIVQTKEDIITMVKMIRGALGKESTFLVIRLKKSTEINGYLPKQAWRWLKKI
jgi:hypothetical protein